MSFTSRLVLALAASAATTSAAEWRVEQELSDATPIAVRIAIKHEADASHALRTILAEVSDPKHDKYGQYLSIDEIAGIIRPPSARLDAVVAWATASGVVGSADDISVNKYGDFASLTLTAADARELFNASMALWTYGDAPATSEEGEEWERRAHVRALDGYTLPAALAPHVELVAGLSEPFPARSAPRPRRRGAEAAKPKPVGRAEYDDSDDDGDDGVCPNAVLYEEGPTPVCLRAHYGIGPTARASGAHGRVAVVQFAASYYTESDLALFQVHTATTTTVVVAAAAAAATPAPWRVHPSSLPRGFTTFTQFHREPRHLVAASPLRGAQKHCLPRGFLFHRAVTSFFLVVWPSLFHRLETRYGTPKQSVAEVIGYIPSAAHGGTEATLDIQWVMGIAQNVPSVVIQVHRRDDLSFRFSCFPAVSGQSKPDNAPSPFVVAPSRDHPPQVAAAASTPFLDWSIAALDDNATAEVHSVSWGTPEYEYDEEIGVDRLNTELVKFGLRGVSVLFASGDDGTGCYGGKYMPNFPASSPYVTAVGGVYIPLFSADFVIEADEISGGGFAVAAGNNRSQAPWQEAVVSAYQKLPASGSAAFYNSAGRGLPDVAAYDAGYNIIQGGSNEQVRGARARAGGVARATVQLARGPHLILPCLVWFVSRAFARTDATERPRMNARSLYMFEHCVLQ